MRGRRLAAAIAGALVAWGGVGLAQRFRLGVEVVSLSVTVTEGNRYVTGLEQAAFEVFEDGVKQDLMFFSRAPMPIALALLIDTSASMEEKLRVAQEAAVGFARRLRPEDVASVIDFDTNIEILQEFTVDKAALEKAIRSTSPGGSTALYNALYTSLAELRKVKATTPDEVRRQAIVVLSDGDDTSSLIEYDYVLDKAKRSETAIYAIGLRPRDDGTRGFKEAEFVLRQLTQETGGRAFFPNDVNELQGIYGTISDELSSQYTLGYTSRNQQRNGAWRRVIVRVAREGAIARTKQGYYAPSPASSIIR
jgi:Ca-activated chloride channel family protein